MQNTQHKYTIHIHKYLNIRMDGQTDIQQKKQRRSKQLTKCKYSITTSYSYEHVNVRKIIAANEILTEGMWRKISIHVIVCIH